MSLPTNSNSALPSTASSAPTGFSENNGGVTTSVNNSPQRTASREEPVTLSFAPAAETPVADLHTPTPEAVTSEASPTATRETPLVATSSDIPTLLPVPVETTSSRPRFSRTSSRRGKTAAPVLTTSEPEPESSTLATLTLTSTSEPSSTPSSSSSAPPPTLISNGTPFGTAKGGQDSPPAKSGRNSASTIAGVIGGLSAAILLGVLLFFLWKWKTRGRYRFNKRGSFGPYGNGIDANRGGVLVSSVACKPADSMSATGESLYSNDDSPTRYHRPSVDYAREPTIPVIDELPERPYRNFQQPPPNKQVSFDLDSPGQVYPQYSGPQPDHGVAGVMPVARPGNRQPPILYERRRPPVPPSMRRNRSPPQNRNYDAGSLEMQPSSPPDQPGYGQDHSHYNMPRSNTISSQMPTKLPVLNQYGQDRMGRVGRSSSLSGIDTGFQGHKPNDGLSMHPIIPEVPSGPSSPMNEKPPLMNMDGAMRPMGVPNVQGNPPKPHPGWQSEPDIPRQLMVRNPNPPTPIERNNKQFGDIVRRMSNSMRHGGDHRPADAGKNF